MSEHLAEGPDLLQEAMAILDIPTLARHLGFEGLKVGINKSPFREDSSPSFSIFDGGKMWKDHAGGEAKGMWDFVKVALGLGDGDKNAIAACIKAAAGFDVNAPLVRAKVRAPAEKLFQHSPLWNSEVRDRFEVGRKEFTGDKAALERLADRRGWQVRFLRDLVEMGLLSRPLLPWSDHNVRGAKRGVAFRVDSLDAVGECITSLPVGYHQRFQIDEGKKQWVYVPYCPGSAKSHFQQTLVDMGQRIHTYPFFMGDPKSKAWVITEGQWDAANFALACGKEFRGLVFGLRGIATAELFLRCLHAHIQRHRPTVWLVPDNDAAGSAMVKRSAEHPDKPCLLERLRTAGVGKVVISTINPECGKDFNDLYRARWITPADMRAWAGRLGVEGEYFASAAAPAPVTVEGGSS